MTSIALEAAQFAIHYQVGLAGTEDVVTFSRDHASVEVAHHAGTEPLYLTLTGRTASVGGRDCYAIQPGQVLELDVATTGPTIARLICASTVTYSITGV